MGKWLEGQSGEGGEGTKWKKYLIVLFQLRTLCFFKFLKLRKIKSIYFFQFWSKYVKFCWFGLEGQYIRTQNRESKPVDLNTVNPIIWTIFSSVSGCQTFQDPQPSLVIIKLNANLSSTGTGLNWNWAWQQGFLIGFMRTIVHMAVCALQWTLNGVICD